MTTTSDIAFWETVKSKITLSRLHDLLTRLAIFWDCLRRLPMHRCLFLLVVFVPICFFAVSRARNPKEDQTATRAALQALVAVIVPTCSLWPSRYIKLAKNAPCSHIDIPLEVIIKDAMDGVMEFRNPNNNLADLIGSGTTVNGHTICMTLGWKWWIRYFRWWMLAEKNAQIGQLNSDCSLSHSPVSTSGLVNCVHCNKQTATARLDLPSSSPPLALHHPLCLDCLPRGVIPIFNAGSKATLEFSAFSSSLQTLSTVQIVSAIPFIISGHLRRRPRPPISVLRQLNASYGSKIVIDSLSNVSVGYERVLSDACNSLFKEQKFRETWVKVLGIEAWRREVFLVALEAALVRRGWIERWALQITVQ